MSTRRKRRRVSERRLAKINCRTPISIWAIITIALVVLGVGMGNEARRGETMPQIVERVNEKIGR